MERRDPGDRRGGDAGLDLARAVADLRAFAAVRDRARSAGRRCRLSFQVTAQEANVAELAGIVRLAASLGVERVKVNQLQPRFPALAARSLRRSAEAIRRWNAAVAEVREAADEARLPSGERVLLENVAPLAEDPAARAPAGPCRFVGKEAWVHPDGRFAPCPHPAAVEGRARGLRLRRGRAGSPRSGRATRSGGSSRRGRSTRSARRARSGGRAAHEAKLRPAPRGA